MNAPARPTLTHGLTVLFAFTCALAVATVYFVQPLLDAIGPSLDVPQGHLGLVVTFTQLGYAAGLVLIVPLGDRLDRRTLIISQLCLSTLALLMAACSPSWGVLLLAMLIVGSMAVVIQVLVAFTASIASPSQRGQAIGTVTSGVVMGILLARLVSGLVADLAGWRVAFLLFATLMLVSAATLYRLMPRAQLPASPLRYRALLASLFRLLLTQRTLRRRGLLALLVFADFSVFWSAMVLPLSAAPLSLSHTQIGLLGLAGVAGALAAAKAGGWADRGLGSRTTIIALALLTLSWLPLAWGPSSLSALLLGVLLLDFAVQALHVTNQSLIFASQPHDQSQLVGAYMCFYSVGSGLGALAATQVYALWGWLAVCVLGAAIGAVAFVYGWAIRSGP